MINITKNSGTSNKYVMEFIADTIDDIKNLTTECSPGSTCLVISTTDVYILSGNSTWEKLQEEYTWILQPMHY